MTSAISSEIKKAIAYVKTHHLVHKIEHDLELIEQFLKNHSADIIIIVKATVQAVKGDSAKPIGTAIGEVADFPSKPNAKNVMDWIANDLIPALNKILTQLSKDEPDEKKYIDIIEDVLKALEKVLDFILMFMK